MKITRNKELPNGRRRLTVELEPGESIHLAKPGQSFKILNPDRFYRLGEPMDDVMQGHILADADEVTWCSIEQKWVR